MRVLKNGSSGENQVSGTTRLELLFENQVTGRKQFTLNYSSIITGFT
jgi:hypothetical protein